MRARKILGWTCVVLWASIGLYAATTSTAHKKSAAKKSTAAAAKSESSKKSGGKAAPKKSAGKKSATKSGSASASKTTTAPKTGSKSGAKTSASKRGKKGATASKTTWRNRQLAPSPDRYKQIQDALVAKGFLKPDDATGQWGQNSADALKKFQAAQNIESNGKINSLSLIALGLGPRRETPAGVPKLPPPAPAPSKPPEAPPEQP